MGSSYANKLKESIDPAPMFTPPPVTARRNMRKMFHYFPWLVLVSSLSVSWLAWHYSMVTLDQAKNDYFDFRVRSARNRILQHMQAYQEVLQGVKGLYVASVSVARNEFKAYVEELRLADNYPGIQGVGFSLIVPAAEKQHHLDAIRAEGFPAYRIYPEGERDPYTSIIYLEPFTDRNLRAFGYDMYSEPVRRAAMEEARDSGQVAMSGKVRLVQESGAQEQAGFLVYLPVYRNGLPLATVAERRANIIGWAYSPFRMNDLMQGILGERGSDLDIEIYDGNNASAGSLMYDSDKSGPSLSAYPLRLQTRESIGFAGHPWTLYIRALAGLHGRVDSRGPLLIAVSGFVISLLLTWLTWSLVRGRENAVRAVIEREKLIGDLQKALAEIKTLEGVLPICCVCKKIRDDKDAWKQLETYLSEHSEAVFTHGYCPECAKKAMEEIKNRE